MNFAETEALIRALKSAGATHFKSQDFEVTFTLGAPLEQTISPISATGPAQAQTPPVAPKEDPEATEKLKQLISTLSLSPEELANKIFPAGAE